MPNFWQCTHFSGPDIDSVHIYIKYMLQRDEVFYKFLAKFLLRGSMYRNSKKTLCFINYMAEQEFSYQSDLFSSSEFRPCSSFALIFALYSIQYTYLDINSSTWIFTGQRQLWKGKMLYISRLNTAFSVKVICSIVQARCYQFISWLVQEP